MVKKDFGIRVDNSTIKGEIKLLFAFDDLSTSDYEKVAWKVATVKYKKEIIQHVPIHWESTIGFALASKDDGHVVHPNTLIAMEPLQTNVLLVSDDDGAVDFKDGSELLKTLAPNQISAENTANQAASVAVGFVENNKLVPTGYIDQLNNGSSWIVTYKPDLTLWIASDGVTGQTFDTIAKSTSPVHVWNLANPSSTPDNSVWVLYVDEHATYRIRRELS